jgi:hypothetical protein
VPKRYAIGAILASGGRNDIELLPASNLARNIIDSGQRGRQLDERTILLPDRAFGGQLVGADE